MTRREYLELNRLNSQSHAMQQIKERFPKLYRQFFEGASFAVGYTNLKRESGHRDTQNIPDYLKMLEDNKHMHELWIL